jgi:hypothetical protein
MKALLLLWDLAFYRFCRHEWVRDRGGRGELLLRCMKCGKSKEHELARLIRWNLPYTPIEPIDQPELPPPLQMPPTGKKRRQAA